MTQASDGGLRDRQDSSTDAGSTREPETPPDHLEWDGTQFLPTSAIADESAAAEYSAGVAGMEPDPWFVVLAFLVGALVLGFSLLALLHPAGDITGLGISAAAGALGVGLIVWGRLEQIRIRPLPKGLRDLSLAERLSRTLRFTPQTLAGNRRGRLSIGQRLRLIGFDAGWWLTVLACIGLVATPFAVAGGRDPIKDLQALVFVPLGLYALWKASGTLIDSARGRVLTDLTTLHPVSQPRSWVTDLIKKWYDSTAHYGYEGKDGMRFAVSRAAFEAITPNRQYRVYFVPLSKRLMSIEPAEDQRSSPG